jgi:MarR family transcriptional regulator, 2-MHQ and catechol-resistance regulon repressor
MCMSKEKISYGQLSDLNLKTLIALTRATQDVQRREQRTIKEGGLTVSQFAVLEILYHKGDLRISEIIEKALSTGGNMTVVIDNLVKEDLVKRCNDPKDRRVNLISITDKGRKLVSDIFPKHVENINEVFSTLTEEEKGHLISLLKKLSGV